MNITPEHVELIVQRVLEHLGTVGGTAPMRTGSVPAGLAPAPATLCVAITEQVVTQSLLADAVNSSKVVRIGPKAILTPSARDFIRSRRIEIIRESLPARATDSDRWQILVTTSTPQIAALVEGLKQAGIACELRLLGLPAEAASEAVAAICRGEASQVVVFTNQPEVVACLSNRNERIHAAAIADVNAAERVRKNMQANLLAIDPAGKGVHELRAYLKAFERS